LAGFVVFGASVLWCGDAQAYKPTDPEVQRMINAGLRFLKTADANKGNRNPEGSLMLMAYATFKVEHDASDPLIVSGVEQAQKFAKMSLKGIRERTYANYEMAVAILLLAEVDPAKYASEINQLRDMLLSGQRGHGGFSYYSGQVGDTSQTQYVMLAMWTLQKYGFEVPMQVNKNLVQWLLLTQDPSGGWGYNGRPSNRIGVYIPQDKDMNPSLSMGAGGSLLMAGELFGFWSTGSEDPRLAGLPPAFRNAKQEEERRRRAQLAGVKPEVLLTAIKRLEPWLKNPTRDNHYRDYYKMYTQERYESFLEVAVGNSDPEPKWYNDGVNLLRSKQSPNGAWGIVDARGSNNDEPGVATAFGILFLIRSTKKAIGSLSQGTTRGGYGLPKDTTQVRMEGGQVKGTPVAGAVDGLLGLLEDDSASELDGQSIPDDLKLATDPEERRKQIDRLVRLVRGSQSWQARRVAARLLGQSGELRVVPALIYALSDPDVPVKRFARDGLRFVSRRFDGWGMPDQPTEQEVKEAQQAWRDWYLSLDPGYVFLGEES